MQGRLEDERTATPLPEFCILQDRNAFIAVHDPRYSQPRRGHAAVATFRHPRVGGVADDRVGRMAARNLRPFLVQIYGREAEEGTASATWVEFDAPVTVGGRHWGAVRMAYRTDAA